MSLPRPSSSSITPPRLTRRDLAGAAIGAAGGLALGRRATPVAAQDATPAASPAGGEWSFTDAVGKTVTLPAPPTRIVADLNIASALWDFGITPLAVSGWSVATDAAWGRLDRATPVINAGPESGDPDLETLLSLQPDIFITIVWDPTDVAEAYSWSFADPALAEQTEQFVPIIGISVAGAADENMQQLAAFAKSIGPDVSAPELAAAIADWEAARTEFAALATEKADLISMFAYIENEGASIANPARWADLVMFERLGLSIVQPDVPEAEYWGQISAEQANKYSADLLFQSARESLLSLDELAAHPTFGVIPAVASGQTGYWNQDFIMSYQGLTASLRDVIGLLATATKVTDPA